jgi:anhydro-N-acetylmuramic acid kinase
LIRLEPVRETTILGLMSGTSCDGLDLALLHFGPGEGEWRLIRGDEHRFPAALRERLLGASDAHTPELGVLSFDLMHWCADQVLQFLGGQTCDLIVSHGQTIFHEPPRATWQLGDGNVLAARLGLPVLWNLRSADVALGGQGAPLVPVPDRFFFQPERGGRCLLNIGGIANLTVLDAQQSGWAGDVGPGNCWIDRFVERRSGGQMSMDKDGLVSAGGRADEQLVERLIGEVRPMLGASLAREWFSSERLDSLIPDRINTADGARSLVALSAQLIAEAIQRHGEGAEALYVAGGGAHNHTLMNEIEQRLGMPLRPFAELGMSGDVREAACFAALGWLFLQRKPAADIGVTGAKSAQILGSIALP